MVRLGGWGAGGRGLEVVRLGGWGAGGRGLEGVGLGSWGAGGRGLEGVGLGSWGAGGRGGRGLEGVGLVEELRVIRWRAAGLLRGGGEGILLVVLTLQAHPSSHRLEVCVLLQ